MNKIIHVDMDQFFAAVEQRENPELRGKPIAVGHDAERGVVSTASYEARRFGVHSAQSIQVAKRLCPQLIIVEPHFQKYKEVSAQLHEIFHDYTDMRNMSLRRLTQEFARWGRCSMTFREVSTTGLLSVFSSNHPQHHC